MTKISLLIDTDVGGDIDNTLCVAMALNSDGRVVLSDGPGTGSGRLSRICLVLWRILNQLPAK